MRLSAKQLQGWMGSLGGSMKPGWKIGLSICTAGFTAARVARSRREGCISRNRMDGDVLWGLRRCSHNAPSAVHLGDAVRILFEFRIQARSLCSSASLRVIQYGDPALILRAWRWPRSIQ